MVLLVLLIILLSIIFGLVVYARWNYGKLEALGLPVANLHFLLGSTHDQHLAANHIRDYEWMKKFGSVFGVYEGRQPQVFVCDPELIRRIFVKDFDHFCDRRRIELGDSCMNEFLDFQPLEKWKVVRSAITPMFSSGRIKKMTHLMNETLEDFTLYIDQKVTEGSGRFKGFDTYSEFFNMSCDLIGRCVFGIKIDHRNNPDDFLTKSLREFFSTSSNRSSFFHSLLLTFPFLTRFAPVFEVQSAANIVKALDRVIEERRKSGVKTEDVLQQTIQLLDRIDTPEFKKMNIDKEVIMAQALLFFMAGPDQFTTVMVFLAHRLCFHPDKEKRLQEELDDFIRKYDGKFEHENLSELVYTNACIMEALRLYPPFFRPERICTKDWEYNGVRIKKGIQVFLPLYAANRNPDYFEDPEDFKPERWLPENKANLHPYAFMSFGHGPRNCIAMRMNYEILTVMVAHIFSKFEFKLRPDTNIEWAKGSLLFIFYEPVIFDIVKRSKSST